MNYISWFMGNEKLIWFCFDAGHLICLIQCEVSHLSYEIQIHNLSGAMDGEDIVSPSNFVSWINSVNFHLRNIKLQCLLEAFMLIRKSIVLAKQAVQLHQPSLIYEQMSCLICCFFYSLCVNKMLHYLYLQHGTFWHSKPWQYIYYIHIL